MRHRIVIGLLGIVVIAGSRGVQSSSELEVISVNQPVVLGSLSFQNSPVTETLFSQFKEVEKMVLPFQTEYQKTEDLELGISQVFRDGENGLLTQVYELTYWDGQVVSKLLLSEEIKEPVSKVILEGTRIVPKTLQTPEGQIVYYLAREMYATSYDGNCPGCGGVTYSGTLVRKGVCAVDPEVISLGSRLYIEGYGFCQAEDIGGCVRGDRIDLGFEDVKNGFWSARWVRVYLLLD